MLATLGSCLSYSNISLKVSCAPELCPGSSAWQGWAARKRLTCHHLLFLWDGAARARDWWHELLSRRKISKDKERTRIKSPQKRKTLISSSSVLHPLECVLQWKNKIIYWIQFHNSLLLLMKTHSWWVLFCISIYACAQGMGSFPLTKGNIVLASRQTLWIIAIYISQQRTWDSEFVCSFGFFLHQLCEGKQWAMLLLNHDLCCSDWKLRLVLRPRSW